MKNKKIPFILLFFSFCFINDSFAQLAEKKLNIYAHYNWGDFLGNEMSDENALIYPNLYSNMSELTGYSLKTTYKILPLFSIGLESEKMTGKNWGSENSEIYNDATVNLRSFSPVFQIHTRFKETGIFNRLKIYGELAPVFGQSKLQLKYPVFDIDNGNTSDKSLLESTDNYFGLKVGTGIDFAFSKAAGIYLAYSVQQNVVSSALYNEEKFLYSQLSFGLYFRLLYDKRFAY